MINIRNKNGAIELSITTVIIIVIGVSLLALGLVLVKNIFGGATDSVNSLNSNTMTALANLFGQDDAANVAVKLGPDSTAKIKAGTDSFGVGIAARTPDGSNVGNRSRLQFTLSLDTTAGNCAATGSLGPTKTKALFKTALNVAHPFDQFSGSNAFAIIFLKIPSGSVACVQKVFIDVKDTSTGDTLDGTAFNLQIIRGGIFG